MEILSTGEKIKRRRVYKGLTLKDICEDKISVSKMSCIENNKVEPEDWILKIIEEKLGLDINYLKYNVRDQIEENIKNFSSTRQLNSAEDVLTNIDYAERYNYYDLSCKLFQILFEYYLHHGMSNEISTTIPRYYNSCQKSKDELLNVNYYIYIAKYLCATEEYSQAGSYLLSARNKLIELNMKESLEYVTATYNLCTVYIESNNIEKAKEVSRELKAMIEDSRYTNMEGEIYKTLAIIEICIDGKDKELYEREAFERFKDSKDKLAIAYYDIGNVKADCFYYDEALPYIRKAISLFPEDNKEEYCEFLIRCVKILVECGSFDFAIQTVEGVLNLSIELNLVPLIDKAYYYKGLIFEKQNNYAMAEVYMILSMDALIKYGTRSQIAKRYMKIGEMYKLMGNVRDAVRYFNLALSNEDI